MEFVVKLGRIPKNLKKHFVIQFKNFIENCELSLPGTGVYYFFKLIEAVTILLVA